MIKHFNSSVTMRCVVTIIMLLIVTITYAVPAKPGVKKLLTLTDGTTVTARLIGDEHGHYWLGDDGKAYQSFGDIYQLVDMEAIRANANKHRQEANQRREQRLAPGRRNVGSVGNYEGEKKGLIILVNFQDVAFGEEHTRDRYDDIANVQNYNDNWRFEGSVRDYFLAQSGGKLDLTFDVVGPVKVSQNQAYYGNNKNNTDGNDEHPAEMVIEALHLVDGFVDFSKYDWYGDKNVDQVYVIYAGQGEADGGASDTIWPHEWTLSSAYAHEDGTGPQTLDGVTINTYACGSELNGENLLAGIGTLCHEFSHCLGYPDFYNTDGGEGQGMYVWDLMDTGCYVWGGYMPSGYTSYERWMAGWQDPIELTSTTAITGMKGLQDGGNTYIIYNKGNRDEYYLLENRQLTGWDTHLKGSGLLILHVDYDATSWSRNKVNTDPDHQRMTWIPADGVYDINKETGNYIFAGTETDPFPYGEVNAFGPGTTPAATLYNPNADGSYLLDASVEQITQNADGTIDFVFYSNNNSFLNDENNTDVIDLLDERTVNVTLTGRTLYKDGSWNTICLPFDVNLTATDCPLVGDGLEVKTLTDVGFMNNELTLTFGNAGDILKAGTPYLIKWTSHDPYVAYNGTNADACSDIVTPTFHGVTIDKTTPLATPAGNDLIAFIGLYNPLHIKSSDNTKLYLGDSNQLYYPNGEMTINAFRAYFQLGEGYTAGVFTGSGEGIKSFILDFGDDETSITEISDHFECSDSYFTLDGFCLSGKPMVKGLYIHNGKKCIIK